MFIGTNHIMDLCLNIDGIISFTSSSVKLLGITIDWKLNFNEHVKNNICVVSNKKLYALSRLRNKLSLNQKLLLFNRFVMSCFQYCPLVWMFCGKVSDDAITIIQKGT